MRKILIIILIAILLILGYFAIFQGLELLGLDVLSVLQIKDKSEELDSKLQRVSTLTSVDKPKAMTTLNESARQLMIEKEEYNDKILASSTEEIEALTQGIQYEMEYLWTKVGTHATKNGVTLRFEVNRSSSGVANKYDLSFTATGAYTSISEFVASLENDAALNFKIENFKIVPYQGGTTVLQSTFTVRNIGIRIDNVTSRTNS